MPRYPSSYRSTSGFSFGPGPLPPAIKFLIIANVAVFVVMWLLPQPLNRLVMAWLGLQPILTLQKLWVWQVATYMFLHAGLFHILFNMLALWMFGTEFERMWGTRTFLKFYFITGVGAGCLIVLASLLPWAPLRQLYEANVVGASGAIYGLLLAYGMYFPDRTIYMYLVFPIPARIFVLIMGAIAFLTSVSEGGGAVAHLGGLLVAYIYLKGARMKLNPWAEVKYRYIKWKINRVRKKFDVYSGGKNDEWNRRVH